MGDIKMRIIKTLLVAGMALMLTLASFGNITMSDGGFGAVQGALGMQTTYQHPHAMWRAIASPALIWLAFGMIVLCEISAAVLCWIGAFKMWQGRGSTELFQAAKARASLGLGVAACLYFIGFLVIAQEYFLMWQSTQLNVLPDAFRIFASAVLIGLWLHTDD
jgi:predicted small integral membrane protein